MQNNQSHWRVKVQELFQVCQDELKRTTEIGKKMLTASKTNTNLHDAYEELGVLVVKAIKSGSLEWDHPRVKELVHQIDNCEKDLEVIEEEVNKIRFSEGPVDISSEGRTRPAGKKPQPSHLDPKDSN